MADKEGMERKVYLLPEELVGRIKAYQAEQGISSEVEAARRLLNEALQAKDSIDDVMRQASQAFKHDKDLRGIARDVLSFHLLVSVIIIDDQKVQFGLRNGDAGAVFRTGELKTGTVSDEGNIWLRTEWLDPKDGRSKHGGSQKSVPTDRTWKPSVPNLDEEIPF